MKHSTIISAIIAALGAAAGVANAVPVTSLTIEDVGSNTANGAGNYSTVQDGISGAYQFSSSPIK